MSARKRDSLRRWKARCRRGDWIPLRAIIEHELTRWFRFPHANPVTEYYRAEPKS